MLDSSDFGTVHLTRTINCITSVFPGLLHSQYKLSEKILQILRAAYFVYSVLHQVQIRYNKTIKNCLPIVINILLKSEF